MAGVYQGPCESLSDSDLARLDSIGAPNVGAPIPTGESLSFSTRDVQPSVGQFVAGADALRFRVFTTQTSTTVRFRGRYLLCINGAVRMVPFGQDVTATLAGGASAVQAVQNDGFVAQLAASVDDDSIQSGDVYVVAEAGRVEGAMFVPYQQLLAGYVTVRLPVVASDTPVVPPEGQTARILVPIANPAAGAEWSYTIGAGQFWRPIVIHYQLTTGAAVANREAGVRIGDGSGGAFPNDAGIYLAMIGGFNHAANRTVYYSWIRGISNNDGTQQPYAHLGLGDLLLRTGDKIESYTTNLQAADQYSNIRILTEVNAE